MKIEIKNPDSVKQSVQQHHKKLCTALEKFTGLSVTASNLMAQHGRLSKKIHDLESSASVESADAVRKLIETREMLRLTESQLESSRTINQHGSAEGQELGRLLSLTRDEVIYPAIAPTIKELINAAAEVFKPYFRPGGWARDLAARSDLVASFSHHVGRSYGTEPSIIEARRAIVLCEAIIAGELGFSFETD